MADLDDLSLLESGPLDNAFAVNDVDEATLAAGAKMATNQDRGWFTTLAGSAGFGAVDLVDSLAASIPGVRHVLGAERGDFNQKVLNLIDSPKMNDFYQDNKGAIEVASGIYGIIGSAYVADRFLGPNSRFMNTVAKMPGGRKIAALDTAYWKAMERVKRTDLQLAQSGAVGLESFSGIAAVSGRTGKAALLGGASKDVAGNLTRNTIRGQALRLGAAKGIRDVALQEAVLATTMNQNGFLFDDDMGQNLFMLSLGLGLGAAAETFSAAYQLRKFNNSDMIRRARVDALDPYGYEDQRLLSHNVAVNLKAPDLESLGFLADSITDRVTSLGLSARTLNDPVASRSAGVQVLESNRKALALQHEEQIFEELTKVTSKGITTDGATRFGPDSAPGHWQHVKRIMREDPAGMYGVRMLGGLADDVSPVVKHESHMKRVNERITQLQDTLKDPKIGPDDVRIIQTNIKRHREELKSTPVAWVDGERVGIAEAEAASLFVEPKIIGSRVRTARANQADYQIWEAFDPTDVNRGYGVGIDTDLNLHLPKGKTLASADFNDVRRLYRAGHAALKHYVDSGNILTLPKKPTYFQLDLAEEVLRRTGNENQVRWPVGMTREKAQVESLAQKIEALSKTKLAAGDDVELSKLRVRYNLPRLTAYEKGVLGRTEHPLDVLIRGGQRDPNAVRKLSLAEIKEGVAQAKRIGELGPSSARDVRSLSGNSFTYMLDETTGVPLKPLMGYVRPMGPEEWTQARVAERIAAKKLFAAGRLTGEGADAVTKNVTQSVLSSPDFDAVARSHELADTQIEGLFGGAGQGFFGRLGRSALTTEFNARDNPIILGAMRLNDSVGRQMRAAMRESVERNMAGQHNLLANPRNSGSKMLLNQYFSHRPGWDLAKETVQRQTPDGQTVHAFLLKETEANKERWQHLFGESMPANATMTAPNRTEIVLDELAIDIKSRYNAMTEEIREMQNTILRANGVREIERVDHYVPSPETDGKLIGFVIGPDGRTVPNMSVVAQTQAEFDRMKAAVLEKLDEKGLGYTFQTKDQIERFATIWDRAQMDFMSASRTPVLAGKQARGSLTGLEVSPDAFEAALRDIEKKYLRHGNDLIETLMKDQINAAKSRAAISSAQSRSNVPTTQQDRFRTIYDMYNDALLGRSALNSPSSSVGSLYNPAEGAIDKMLESLHTKALSAGAKKDRVWQALTAWTSRHTPWDATPLAKKDFDTLSRELGNYMPFKSVSEMLESEGKASLPWTAKGLTNATSQFTAAIMLRVGETAHAVMNLTGIVNALPSVVRHVMPKAGESAEVYAGRIGHSANLFTLPDGKQIGILDITKIGRRAFEKSWKRASHAEYDFMVSRGYLSQEVAELNKQFSSLKTRGDVARFFGGDPSASNKFAQKGVVGWLSVLSDKSEDFSRSWGHFAGLEIADILGVSGKEARHAFAHDIANKMIANYNPVNRPEIFQGAIGAPLGLFQSFIMNYYNRLFRYVETKDYRALATQYATQGSLFGATSVPGWNELNALLYDPDEDLEADFTDKLYMRLGNEAGALLGNGVVSYLPAFFGGESVDLYSRGDTQVRLPVLNAPPAVAMGTKIWEGIQQGLGAFSSKNPNLTSTQLAEIASNMVVNRPLGGVIEQVFAGGNDTDRFGQVTSNTDNWMEATYRIMGVRSGQQSRELDAFYRNRTQQESQNAAKEVLRLSLRSAMRSGDFDSLPKYFEQFLENGGDPKQFKRVLKDAMEIAESTRGERMLQDIIDDPDKMGQVQRLLDSGVGITEDQEDGYDPSELMTPNLYEEVDTELLDYGTDSTAITQ